MNSQSIFTESGFFNDSWTDYLGLSVCALLLALIFTLLQKRNGRKKGYYYADLAWIRGGIYFCSCYLISWGSGVLNTITTSGWPGDLPAQPYWFIAVAIVLIVEYIGYYKIWAIGTLPYGRKLYPVSVVVFGLLWGTAEAQLFLSFFAIAEKTGLSAIWVALITYCVIAVYNGPWHRYYWDFYVAPQHNIPEWNMKKVFYVHTPNIVVSLAYLIIYRDPTGFVLFMSFCLIGSCIIMRFPSPWDTTSHIPIVDTYIVGNPEAKS